jgi:hypothetical protein
MLKRVTFPLLELLVVGLRTEPCRGVVDVQGTPNFNIERLTCEAFSAGGLLFLPAENVVRVQEVVVPCHVSAIGAGPIFPSCLYELFRDAYSV